jgi:hypothetical protein
MGIKSARKMAALEKRITHPSGRSYLHQQLGMHSRAVLLPRA